MTVNDVKDKLTFLVRSIGITSEILVYLQEKESFDSPAEQTMINKILISLEKQSIRSIRSEAMEDTESLCSLNRQARVKRILHNRLRVLSTEKLDDEKL